MDTHLHRSVLSTMASTHTVYKSHERSVWDAAIHYQSAQASFKAFGIRRHRIHQAAVALWMVVICELQGQWSGSWAPLASCPCVLGHWNAVAGLSSAVWQLSNNNFPKGISKVCHYCYCNNAVQTGLMCRDLFGLESSPALQLTDFKGRPVTELG